MTDAAALEREMLRHAEAKRWSVARELCEQLVRTLEFAGSGALVRLFAGMQGLRDGEE